MEMDAVAMQTDECGMSLVPGLRRIRPNGRRMRANYLVEHTVGSIIGGAFKIYSRHFGALFLIYALPVVPISIFLNEVKLSGNAVFYILSLLLYLIVNYFACGATVVV